MTHRTDSLNTALANRYRIVRQLGEGGMATVYLAEDLKHDRNVALKVLRPELAAVLGAERFVQEIKTTASLQHPHILPLFDSGTAGEGVGAQFLFYVMPYIEGETLRDKLNRETQLGIEEAVQISTEVADALHYAHQQGVIHRDIKPENILLHNGRPMVADFGIALAVSAAAGGRMTETGMSLGTPHYMSPEQATAEKDLTARSDIYSLGSVLYEMLTGEPPHSGGSAQQIIMKIVTEEAIPVTRRRKSVPPNVAAAVMKALEKLPADRFEHAGDFVRALKDRQFTSVAAAAASSPAPAASWQRWIQDPRSWTALVAVAGLSILLFIRGTTPAPTNRGVMQFTVRGPVDSTFVRTREGHELYARTGPVVSPDNRYVAFSATRLAGAVVYLRALDSFDTEAVEGDGPFFAPSGDGLGFFRSSEVWTMSLRDRVPSLAGTIPEVDWDIVSVAWHPDGRILVSGARGLWALAASGGDPILLVASDSTRAERFGELRIIDDGRIVLHVLAETDSHVEVLSSDGATRTPIVAGSEYGTIIGDILVFRRSGQLRATRFDLRRLEPVGDPIGLPDMPYTRLNPSIAWVDPDDAAKLELVWVDEDGRVTPVGQPPDAYRWPRVSPNGERIVVGLEPPIAVFDVRRGFVTTLAGSSEPVWSRDGTQVFMSKGNRPAGGLLAQVWDGSRAPDTLLALDDGDSWPTDVSPDGRWLAYYGATLGSGTGSDLTDPNDVFFLDLEARESRRVRLPGAQRGARFSPDGRWVAYQSTESSREEVHLRPWPAMDANFRVSTDGGIEPIWSHDGRELYYRNRGQILAVGISQRDGRIERSPPQTRFADNFAVDDSGDQSYDLAPNGRFLMLRPVAGGRAAVQVTLNWIDDVRARLERAR